MCTPWDEIATEFLIKINIDIIKVASCSFNDWSLLESISRYKKRIIASTAGATKIEIDKVYSFFKNKLSDFAFMHCVGEYPTPDENLHLNQIEYLRNNYQDIEIGYSTHEKPDNYLPISIAIAKGATIFEKHVGIKNEEYNINDYSATPEMCKNWLEAARKTYKILGPFVEKRKNFSDKETSDLRILYRGVYAKNDLNKNHIISDNDFFLSMPNIDGQLVAKDMGKFIKYSTKVDINQQ
jgi:sialic acid synthase SpsE